MDKEFSIEAMFSIMLLGCCYIQDIDVEHVAAIEALQLETVRLDSECVGWHPALREVQLPYVHVLAKSRL